MHAASVTSRQSFQTCVFGSGLADDAGRIVATLHRHRDKAPSFPAFCNNKGRAKVQIVATTTSPIAMAAHGKPSNPMAATQSGEKTTPPMLDPL